MTEKLYFYGLKENGAYAFKERTLEDFGKDLVVPRQPRGLAGFFSRILAWIRGNPMPLMAGFSEVELIEAGWGLVLPETPKNNYEALLEPLLTLRKEQAGERFKVLTYRADESAGEFLEHHGAEVHPVDPRRIPYYLLIVGSLREIPLDFQYELDVQYAVGRIAFEEPQSYKSFAKNVVAAEKKREQERCRTVWFGTKHEGDPATGASYRHLIRGIHGMFKSHTKAIVFGHDQGQEHAAVKANLAKILEANQPPDFLFTASHAVVCSPDSPNLREWQGALICDDHRSMHQGLSSEQVFAARDIETESDQLGMVAFLFGCFTAACPTHTDFPEKPGASPAKLADEAFISPLAEKLLGKANGCAAIIGHVDSAYPWSFTDHEADAHLQLFENFFRNLTHGHRLGYAMEAFQIAYAGYQVDWEGMQTRKRKEKGYRPGEDFVAKLWLRINDTRNYIILGDPAVAICRHRPMEDSP